MIALSGVVCAWTHSVAVLIGARFTQGLFIPSVTTCIAAYLARHFRAERLNVVLGSWVAATVAGGLGGRIHPPLHWQRKP